MDELITRLYDTHQERLRRRLSSLGVSAEDLDDLVQEAFIRLHLRLSDGPIEREKYVAYLYSIARNLATDWHRRNKRVGQVEAHIDDTVLQSIADEAPEPEEVYDEKELQEERLKAIEKLPKKVAEAVKGLLEGKSLKIIAQEIGVQVPALKYRLRQARDLLNNTKIEEGKEKV